MSNAIIITVKVVLVALVAIRLLTLGYFGGFFAKCLLGRFGS